MPAVRTFALTSGVAVTFDFLLQVSAFVALLSLDGRRQEVGGLPVPRLGGAAWLHVAEEVGRGVGGRNIVPQCSGHGVPSVPQKSNFVLVIMGNVITLPKIREIVK